MKKQLKLDIYNQEGLEFLKSIEDNTVDLILTDPPYITSTDTGMDRWYDKVANIREEQKKLRAEAKASKDKRIEDKAKSENISKEEAKERLQEEFKKEAKEAKLERQKYQDKKWDEYVNSKSYSHAALELYIDKKIKLDKGDPKYASERSKIIATAKKNYVEYDSIYGAKYAVRTNYGTWDTDFTMAMLDDFMEEFHRILKPSGTIIIFFDFWKISSLKKPMEILGFNQLRFIEWIKTNPQPLNSSRNYLTNCREIALTAVKKGGSTFNSKYDNGIYEYPIQGENEVGSTFNSKYDNGVYKYPIQGGDEVDRFHPTQKNLKMLEDLVMKHSNEGDLVLDCFLGSGTTALACMNTGRSFIGCEADEKYYEKMVSRIERNKSRTELIDESSESIQKKIDETLASIKEEESNEEYQRVLDALQKKKEEVKNLRKQKAKLIAQQNH